jgi:glycosyltransferase involved in cell wall biosynthesis
LQIVGRGAKKALQNLARGPDIAIHENVPDIAPYFRNTDVLLYAPSQGSGMKVKVMEAFAFGVPVVTTKEGVEGFPAVDGVHAGIGEDDATIIERTVALLNERALRDAQRLAARSLLETHCSPDTTLDGIEAVYKTVINHTQPIEAKLMADADHMTG